MAKRNIARPFNERSGKALSPFHLGGKGKGLATMAASGLPVPPGFTLLSDAHRAFMEHGRLPKRVQAHVRREIIQLEQATGYGFGRSDMPLLVSVRSGAEESMPGMMDTILNVGLTTDVLTEIEQHQGARFANEILANLTRQWPHHVVLSDDPYDQLFCAIEAVFASWESARAVAYRNAHGIESWKGTAVTIQTMVYGNLDQRSCTGVVFSVNPSSGQKGLFGEFLPMAQGEDVVGGTRMPRPIAEFANWNAELDIQLRTFIDQLASHYGWPVDVEFTVESGKLFILQVRRAKLSPAAEIVSRVHAVWRKEMTKQQAIEDAPNEDMLPKATLSVETRLKAQQNGLRLGVGLKASPGVATGIVAHSIEKARELAKAGKSVIFMRYDTKPEDLPGMLAAKAVVTSQGGTTCHASIVARELGIPAVVGVRFDQLPAEGTVLTIDGTEGEIYQGELVSDVSKLPKEVGILRKWKAQHATIWVDFDAHTQRFAAHQFLIDCYLLSALLREYEVPEVKQQHDEMYRKVAGVFALYLLLATTREARHSRHQRQTAQNVVAAMARIEAILKINLLSLDFRPTIRNVCVQAVKAMSSKQLAEYTADLLTIFRKGRWHAGYGGDAWAKITETLLLYLRGEISPVVFVDAVFDLRHNGGRLFDKHAMLSVQTGEDVIRDMLDKKKYTRTLAALHDALVWYSQPSPEVAVLYARCTQKEGK